MNNENKINSYKMRKTFQRFEHSNYNGRILLFSMRIYLKIEISVSLILNEPIFNVHICGLKDNQTTINLLANATPHIE